MTTDRDLNLIPNENGTLTDLETGLIWMVPMVGQAWNGSESVENPIPFSWPEASEKFGRGRYMEVSEERRFQSFLGHAHGNVPPVIRDSYKQYAPGSERVEFAGCVDWRLPTLEEWLSVAGKKGTISVLKFQFLGEMWMANPSNLKPNGSILVTFRKLERVKPLCAWMSQGSTVFPDNSVSRTRHVTLVRSGRIWDLVS